MQDDNSRVLITGSTGFIGRNITKWANDRYKNVFTTSRTKGGKNHFGFDLSHSQSVQYLIKETQPDIIIHLASTAVNKISDSDPCSIIDNNICSTLNLLHYCNPETKFVLASSIVVYDESLKIRYEDDPVKPVSIYGMSKLLSEQLVTKYADKIRPLILRMSATIGADLTHGLVKDVINNVKQEGSVLPLWGGSPGPRKSFTYVSDVVSAIQLLLDRNETGTFNTCVEDNLSVLEVANTIMRTINRNKHIVWDASKQPKNDNNFLLASNTKLRSLGWNPVFSKSRDSIVKATYDAINS